MNAFIHSFIWCAGWGVLGVRWVVARRVLANHLPIKAPFADHLTDVWGHRVEPSVTFFPPLLTRH